MRHISTTTSRERYAGAHPLSSYDRLIPTFYIRRKRFVRSLGVPRDLHTFRANFRRCLAQGHSIRYRWRRNTYKLSKSRGRIPKAIWTRYPLTCINRLSLLTCISCQTWLATPVWRRSSRCPSHALRLAVLSRTTCMSSTLTCHRTGSLARKS